VRRKWLIIASAVVRVVYIREVLEKVLLREGTAVVCSCALILFPFCHLRRRHRRRGAGEIDFVRSAAIRARAGGHNRGAVSATSSPSSPAATQHSAAPRRRAAPRAAPLRNNQIDIGLGDLRCAISVERDRSV